MAEQNNDQPPSDYPELTIPVGGFKSNIPEHLFKDDDPQMRWLMEEMSKNTQATEFCVRAAVDTNAQVRKTNGRLKGAEQKIIDSQADIEILKKQMLSISPVINTVNSMTFLFTNKAFLVFFFMSILFLLGYNRDILGTIFKVFFN
jgi:hypothetical protein